MKVIRDDITIDFLQLSSNILRYTFTEQRSHLQFWNMNVEEMMGLLERIAGEIKNNTCESKVYHMHYLNYARLIKLAAYSQSTAVKTMILKSRRYETDVQYEISSNLVYIINVFEENFNSIDEMLLRIDWVEFEKSPNWQNTLDRMFTKIATTFDNLYEWIIACDFNCDKDSEEILWEMTKIATYIEFGNVSFSQSNGQGVDKNQLYRLESIQ